MVPCDLATDLPDHALTHDEVARFWGRDRAALGDCGQRQAALAAAVKAMGGQGTHQGAGL